MQSHMKAVVGMIWPLDQPCLTQVAHEAKGLSTTALEQAKVNTSCILGSFLS